MHTLQFTPAEIKRVYFLSAWTIGLASKIRNRYIVRINEFEKELYKLKTIIELNEPGGNYNG